MGGKVNHSLNEGRGVYVFSIAGQIYHHIGSLIPPAGSSPKFAQLYIHETEKEVDNRMHAISVEIDKNPLREFIISGLKEMLDDHNILVQTFRYAKHRLSEEDVPHFKIKLLAKRRADGREYDMPTGDEVAGLIITDSTETFYEQDIIVQRQSTQLERISLYHPSLMSLQYPLIFPYGEDGWRSDTIGDGDECSIFGEAETTIPKEFAATRHGDPITDIVSATYPDILSNYHNPTYLASRAVLAPHHEMVHKINKYLLSQMPSEESTYLSSDYVENANGKLHSMDHDLPVEMLNTLQVAGFPDHEIKLKVGVPIILLRNIDQSAGLCNGTRMIVKVLGQWFIAAEIIAGTNIGESFFLPRMTLTTDYPSLDITLSRRQYPIALCFAMTINKSQGQSLEQVGLCLQQQVFSHGQLYVALSRVTRKTGLKILSCDQNGKATETMQNIVFKEIFF
ncbi:ATP-dependent DNA helicase PIF1 [Linum perenne]